MKIAVTGASGYIGEYFAKLALASGHQVAALTRRAPESFVCSWIPYELSSNQAPTLPSGINLVVHLATDTSFTATTNSTQEELAAELLINATQEVGAKFIFVSSQTARPDAPTAYGRTKWRIEQKVIASCGKVIRPGQVYGGIPRGLFGELLKTVQRTHILPAFLPAPKVQPIHVDDLVLGMLRVAERFEHCPDIMCLASNQSVTFTAFLSSIARYRLRLFRSFVPVPSYVVDVSLKLFGKRTNLNRLSSLFDLPQMDTESDLRQLGLRLRSLESGMNPSGDCRRRHLLIEGWVLLTYVLKRQPVGAVLRNYVRVIECLRGGNALAIPKLFVRWPVLLALVDGCNSISTSWKNEFVWRLDAATVLAEATIYGARRFLGSGGAHGLVASFFGITRAVLSEAGWRILGVLLAPATRVALPRTWDQHR